MVRRDACSAKRVCQGQPGKLSFASGNTAGIVGGRRIISASAENRGNFCQRKHPAEILALGRAAPSTVAARTRIVSVAGIRLDPGNQCDLSKGYFATTFLSSSPSCPASQSGLHRYVTGGPPTVIPFGSTPNGSRFWKCAHTIVTLNRPENVIAITARRHRRTHVSSCRHGPIGHCDDANQGRWSKRGDVS